MSCDGKGRKPKRNSVVGAIMLALMPPSMRPMFKRNPVKPPKRSFWVGPARRSDTADGWRGDLPEQAGSWWDDWMAWLKPQCGELVDAPAVSNEAFPALGAAPGSYVLEH